MNPCLIMEQLNEEQCLVLSEYEMSMVYANSHRYPRYKVNRILLKLVKQKSLNQQQKFAEILSSAQSELCRDREEPLQEEFLQSKHILLANAVDFERCQLLNKKDTIFNFG